MCFFRSVSLIFTCTLILFIDVNNLNAQELYFYKHFEGTINKKHIIADIFRVSNQISGSYYYNSEGKLIEISGTINTQGEIELKEPNNSLFKGKFTDNNNISGTYESASENQVYPFELSEANFEGTMPFKYYYYKSQKPYNKSKHTPIADIELSLILPENYPNKIIADSILRAIILNFNEENNSNEAPLSLFKEITSSYYNQFDKFCFFHWDSTLYLPLHWQKAKIVKIIMNEIYILSIGLEEYCYTNQENGLKTNKYINYNLKTGKRISIFDVFKPDNLDSVKVLLNNKFRKIYSYSKYTDLVHEGFNSNLLDLTENFYICRNGICFCYKPDELGSVTIGTVNVFLSFKEIYSLLKDRTLIKNLANL